MSKLKGHKMVTGYACYHKPLIMYPKFEIIVNVTLMTFHLVTILNKFLVHLDKVPSLHFPKNLRSTNILPRDNLM